MPLGASPYADETALRQYLPDLDSDAGTTTLLNAILGRISDIIDIATKRSFDQITEKRVFSIDPDQSVSYSYNTVQSTSSVLPGTRILFVPDLVSVGAGGLSVRTGGTGSSLVVVPDADVFLGPSDKQKAWPYEWVELSDVPTGTVSYFPVGLGIVELTGTWGWPAIPPSVVQCCLELSVRAYRARGLGHSDAVGVEGLDQLIDTRAFTAQAKRVLDRLCLGPQV